MERADHLFSPQWSWSCSLMSVGVPLYSLSAESHLAGTFPHPCKGICFRMLTVQGLQHSIWAVWTSGRLPKSLRSPSIPQESWKRTAAKHMSLSHELGDQHHTTAAVHSSLWPANSYFSLSFSRFLSCCVHPLPPPPVRAHTFSLKLRVSLSAVRIASSVITGASLLARCSGYPCRHGWIQCRTDSPNYAVVL